MVAPTCNHSPQTAAVGGSEEQGSLKLQSKFKANLGYVGFYLKYRKKIDTKIFEKQSLFMEMLIREEMNDPGARTLSAKNRHTLTSFTQRGQRSQRSINKLPNTYMVLGAVFCLSF